MRVGDGFVRHVIAAHRPDQRHTLGRAERQIEAVHTALTERAPARPVGRDPVIQPARHHLRIGLPAGALHITQPDQLRGRVGVAGAQPHRGAGVAFGVVLPQTAIGALGILGGLPGGAGGVVVVVDRPPRQLRDRWLPDVGYGSFADIADRCLDVGFVPLADIG